MADVGFRFGLDLVQVGGAVLDLVEKDACVLGLMIAAGFKV